MRRVSALILGNLVTGTQDEEGITGGRSLAWVRGLKGRIRAGGAATTQVCTGGWGGDAFPESEILRASRAGDEARLARGGAGCPPGVADPVLGLTPLHLASRVGSAATVRALLEAAGRYPDPTPRKSQPKAFHPHTHRILQSSMDPAIAVDPRPTLNLEPHTTARDLRTHPNLQPHTPAAARMAARGGRVRRRCGRGGGGKRSRRRLTRAARMDLRRCTMPPLAGMQTCGPSSARCLNPGTCVI